MKIFLSYSSKQQDLAEQICLELEQHGRHHVFFDKKSLKAGDDFRRRIRNELDQSEVFVFLISPASVAPGSYARSELDIAREKWPQPKEHVLAVMAVETALESVPPYLKVNSILRPEGEVVEAVSRRLDDWSPMEEVDVVEATRRVLEERGTPPAVAGLLALSVAIGKFQEEVLERGTPNTTYRRRIRGVVKGQGPDARLVQELTDYNATAGREYKDDQGRTCRELTLSHCRDGKWTSGQTIYSLQRGKWVPVPQS